jgi:hypothetical protein
VDNCLPDTLSTLFDSILLLLPITSFTYNPSSYNLNPILPCSSVNAKIPDSLSSIGLLFIL